MSDYVTSVSYAENGQTISLGNKLTSQTGNNGTIQAIIINSPGLSATQNYSYDLLNRLASASEGGSSWAQTYGYVNNNRYVSSNTGFTLSPFTPTVKRNFDTANRLPNGASPCNPSVTAASWTTYIYASRVVHRSIVIPLGLLTCAVTSTCFITADQLGSTRLVTDSNGNAVRRYDYLPFGEELFAGIGGSTAAVGYQSGADGFNPKFTGQERDPESRLD